MGSADNTSKKQFMIKDLIAGNITDQYIELSILSCYDIVDNQARPYNPSLQHHIINSDGVDNEGFRTVTLYCYGPAFCKQFSELLQVGNTVQVSGFDMKTKNSKNEFGDIKRSIQLTTKSTIDLIPDFDPVVTTKFYTSDMIAMFKRQLSNNDAHATLAVAVWNFVTVPKTRKILSVQIADGTTQEDRFFLDMGLEKCVFYNSLCDKISKGVPPLLLLKNITTNNFGSHKSFKITNATIIADVCSDKQIKKLTAIFHALSGDNPITKSLRGTLFVLNPGASPYKITCSNCGLEDFCMLSEGFTFCNDCKKEFKSIEVPQLDLSIQCLDDTILPCFTTGIQMEQVLNHTQEEFSQLGEEEKIDLLGSISLLGDYKITPLNQICNLIYPLDIDDPEEREQKKLKLN